MRNGSKYALLFALLAFGCFTSTALANNSVSLIRTPVSVQKSRAFCFQQQGIATKYNARFIFTDSTSGIILIDGTLVDSFPPTRDRWVQQSGVFKSGLHKITLTLDKEATLSMAVVAADSTSGAVNLLPVLSCTSTKQVLPTASNSNQSSLDISEINKKLSELEARVNKLELLVEGKQKSKQQAGTAKAVENETLDQKLNRLQKEATAMSNLGTALLKNAGEWKKEINALRASSK